MMLTTACNGSELPRHREGSPARMYEQVEVLSHDSRVARASQGLAPNLKIYPRLLLQGPRDYSLTRA